MNVKLDQTLLNNINRYLTIMDKGQRISGDEAIELNVLQSRIAFNIASKVEAETKSLICNRVR